MKKTFLTMAIVAVGLLIGLSACNKGDHPWDPNGGDDGGMMVTQNVPDEYMPYFDAEEFTLEGDLSTNDIEVYPEFNGKDDHKGDDRCPRGDKWRDRMKGRHGQGFELRILLRTLRLDEDQRAQFGEILKGYRDCVHDVMMASADQRKEIMDRAREAKMDIINKYRAGDINRGQAIKALRELYVKVKEALDALVDKDALCNCYISMLRQLYGILTPEQQRMFMVWLKNSKNPCLDGFSVDK